MARHDVCACCQLWSNRTLHLARGEAGFSGMVRACHSLQEGPAKTDLCRILLANHRRPPAGANRRFIEQAGLMD